MTFVRSKLGGWIAGTDKLKPKQLSHMSRNLSLALDGAAGGSYFPTGDINITDGAGGSFGAIDVLGKLWFHNGTDPRMTLLTGTVPDVINQTLGITSGGQILRCVATTVAIHQHELTNTGAAAGDWIVFISPVGSAFNTELYVDGAGPGYAGADLIVTMAAGGHSYAWCYHDGTDWRLSLRGNAAPGAAA